MSVQRGFRDATRVSSHQRHEKDVHAQTAVEIINTQARWRSNRAS